MRNIPYGIQQPAVSGQVAQLEQYLGVVLFHRRPFALTPQGEKLYKFIQPFFANLEAMAAELQRGRAWQIRIGASTIVLRDHLPQFLSTVRKKYPALKVYLREGYQPELESWLQKEELDLAVTLIEKRSSPGIRSEALIELPLVLLVPKESSITAPEQLWKCDRIEEPLICMPQPEAISRNFQEGLTRLGVDWFPSMEVSSIDLIQTYVANGFGIGVAVLAPKTAPAPQVRALRLPASDFRPVVVGALWRGKISPLLQVFLDELRLKARQLS